MIIQRKEHLFLCVKVLQLVLYNTGKVVAKEKNLEICKRYTHATVTQQSKHSSMQEDSNIMIEVKKIIPPLASTLHKGQAGRITVIGGSEEYTGGPYFAAISAMKVGADLGHVFCTSEASPVIKSYSPELIVHPLLDRQDPVKHIKDWMARMHSVVVGPGLGRQPSILKTVKEIMAHVQHMQLPLIVDADGLFLVTEDPSVVHGYEKAILTPNAIEFQRLAKAMNVSVSNDPSIDVACEETIALSKAMGGVTIVRKGRVDIIARNTEVLKVFESGSPRRCGGQGDLLSGSLGVFSFWAHTRLTNGSYSPNVLAGYASCFLTKRCAARAFAKYGRSTTTTDLINEIHAVFDDAFENHECNL